MTRAAARWWLAVTLAALAATLGYAVGVLTTPTVDRTTYLDCTERQFWAEAQP